MGNAEGALAAKRQDILAGLLSDRARATQLEIWAAEQANQAIEAAKAGASTFANALADSMNRAGQAAQSLRDFNDSLLLGNLSVLSKDDQYALAKQQLAAATPDNLQAAASAFLQASKEREAGGYAYARDFAMVQSLIGKAARGQDGRVTSLENFARMVGGSGMFNLPSFDVGTNYLPETMPILAHKGERVIPAADNAALMARLSSPAENSAAVVAELRALRAEVAALRQTNSEENLAIAKHAMNTADHLDAAINGETPLATKVIPA
jgi:glycosyltransferase involved in cell wall biosynthesis